MVQLQRLQSGASACAAAWTKGRNFLVPEGRGSSGLRWGPTLLWQGDALLSLEAMREGRSVGQLRETVLSLQEPGVALLLQGGGLGRVLGERGVLQVSEGGLL